jgi:predicted esterase
VTRTTRTIAGLHVEQLVFEGPSDGHGRIPLVIALHGRGGVPERPFGASARACRVLVPRGPVVLGAGFAWSSRYAREGKNEALARDLSAITERLAEVLEIVRAERPETGRTIAVGFSQGAMAALALATRHAMIDEVVAGAAWLPPGLEPIAAPARELRIRLAHGRTDDVVPFRWAEALADRMRDRGFDIELRSFADVGHASAPAMDAQLRAWCEEAIARAR